MASRRRIASVTSSLVRDDVCDFRLRVSIGVPIDIESGSPYRDRQTFPIVQPRNADYAPQWGTDQDDVAKENRV